MPEVHISRCVHTLARRMQDAVKNVSELLLGGVQQH